MAAQSAGGRPVALPPQPVAVLDGVAQALRALSALALPDGDNRSLLLRIAPPLSEGLHGAVNRMVQQCGSGRPVRIVIDHALMPGDWVIESPHGCVDARHWNAQHQQRSDTTGQRA